MKKLEYIAPFTKMVIIEHCNGIMVTSPTKTNIPDVGVWSDPAPTDMEGHSREVGSVWDEWDF